MRILSLTIASILLFLIGSMVWYRLLPIGVTHGQHQDHSQAYTLFLDRFDWTVRLIDRRGQTVHRWQLNQRFRWEHTELLPSGELLAVTNRRSGQRVGRIERIDRCSHPIEIIEGPVHHDAQAFGESGKLYTLTQKKIPISKSVIENNYIVELNAQRQVTWVWDFYAHLDELTQLLPNTNIFHSGDLFHANSLAPIGKNSLEERDPRFRAGNILVSALTLQAMFIVNRQTGEITWGQPIEGGQHHATMLSNGNILAFHNGSDKKQSSAIELNPLTREIVWRYPKVPHQGFFSGARGSAQRLPNGNTLISLANQGRIVEVSANHKIVWQYQEPKIFFLEEFIGDRTFLGENLFVYRAYRYSPATLAQVKSMPCNRSKQRHSRIEWADVS